MFAIKDYRSLHDERQLLARRYRIRSLVLLVLCFASLALFPIAAGYGLVLVSGGARPQVLFFLFGAAWGVVASLNAARGRQKRIADGLLQPTGEEALAEAKQRGRPVVLFLRGFEAERVAMSSDQVDEDTASPAERVESRSFEATLKALVGGNAEIVALPDPRDPTPTPGACRIETVPQDWLSLVRHLSTTCSGIFVYVTSFTPGIRDELAMLRTSGHWRNAIVVLGRNLARASARERELVFAWVSGMNYVCVESTSRSWRRSTERAFHLRLRDLVRKFELERLQGNKLTASDALPLPPTVPNPLMRVTRFLRGPAVSGAFAAALFIVMKVFLFSEEANVARHFRQHLYVAFIAVWPAAVGILTFIKLWFLLRRTGERMGEKTFNMFQGKVSAWWQRAPTPEKEHILRPPPLR